MIINDLKKVGSVFFSIACLLACGMASTSSQAQVVGLDNWFNKETHAKTGLTLSLFVE